MSVRVEREEGGKVLRLVLDAGKGNVFDAKLVSALQEALGAVRDQPEARCAVLTSAGPSFSYGASVEEHRAATVADMLARFHRLIRCMLDLPIPILVAVRGQCLGGGLEVAMAGSRVFAHPEARLGQPEIKLGVFAPAASALLPLRIHQADAEMLLLTGRSLTGEEAHRIGLVDELCAPGEDPAARALAFAHEALLPLSATSLRLATRAARGAFAARAFARIAELEHLYLEELMATHDAVEGIAAFLEERPPRWQRQERTA